MSDTFPPTGPTGLTTQIPAYLYGQYADDEDLQAFFQAFNDYGQAFLNWFVTLNLPIYTGLSGYLLDWVAQGVYGISRPALAYGSVTAQGAVNTFAVNTLAVNAYTQIGSIDIFVVNDDIFKRIITWFFFKATGSNIRRYGSSAGSCGF